MNITIERGIGEYTKSKLPVKLIAPEQYCCDEMKELFPRLDIGYDYDYENSDQKFEHLQISVKDNDWDDYYSLDIKINHCSNCGKKIDLIKTTSIIHELAPDTVSKWLYELYLPLIGHKTAESFMNKNVAMSALGKSYKDEIKQCGLTSLRKYDKQLFDKAWKSFRNKVGRKLKKEDE